LALRAGNLNGGLGRPGFKSIPTGLSPGVTQPVQVRAWTRGAESSRRPILPVHYCQLSVCFPPAMASGSSAMLDIHRVSPVRGQLEPHDPRTPKGSRYIQCTETPNELKVRPVITRIGSSPHDKPMILGFTATRYSSYV
jgi:hypothetical protein